MKLGIPETFAVAQRRAQKKKWPEVKASKAMLMCLALTLEAVGPPLRLVFEKGRDLALGCLSFLVDGFPSQPG